MATSPPALAGIERPQPSLPRASRRVPVPQRRKAWMRRHLDPAALLADGRNRAFGIEEDPRAALGLKQLPSAILGLKQHPSAIRISWIRPEMLFTPLRVEGHFASGVLGGAPTAEGDARKPCFASSGNDEVRVGTLGGVGIPQRPRECMQRDIR